VVWRFSVADYRAGRAQQAVQRAQHLDLVLVAHAVERIQRRIQVAHDRRAGAHRLLFQLRGVARAEAAARGGAVVGSIQVDGRCFVGRRTGVGRFSDVAGRRPSPLAPLPGGEGK